MRSNAIQVPQLLMIERSIKIQGAMHVFRARGRVAVRLAKMRRVGSRFVTHRSFPITLRTLDLR
jgi:hypothetical protein